VRYQGRVTDWRDEKGFGFITPNGGNDRVFFHIKALRRSSRRPVQDDRVNYTLGSDANGRQCAIEVEFVVKPRAVSSWRSSKPTLVAVAVAFAVLLAALVATGRLPTVVGLVYAIASFVTFFAYAIDKAAARADRWRTQESTLHMLGVVGGWPGGLIAQQLLRHKSRKTSFVAVFWVSAGANVCALLWLMSSSGQEVLRRLAGGNG
jgi:uncharacterized membrane protein YsdA (DUF1294 family)/cold shock CspA family protein